jgi:hypothetical protein
MPHEPPSNLQDVRPQLGVVLGSQAGPLPHGRVFQGHGCLEASIHGWRLLQDALACCHGTGRVPELLQYLHGLLVGGWVLQHRALRAGASAPRPAWSSILLATATAAAHGCVGLGHDPGVCAVTLKSSQARSTAARRLCRSIAPRWHASLHATTGSELVMFTSSDARAIGPQLRHGQHSRSLGCSMPRCSNRNGCCN